MKNYQGIFQIKNDDGIWRDFARESVRDMAHARTMMAAAAIREGRPFRVRVEHWNEYPEKREPETFIGDWDRSLLSPAAQSDGVFMP